jgi:hypothetical protein
LRAAARSGLAAVVLAIACSGQAAGGSLTTDTDSRTLPDRQQRLGFLARYLRSKSPITDAEFNIHYRDNSGGGVPGPSDWDIRAALQVADTAAWRAGWEPCPAAGSAGTAEVPAWARALVQRPPEWQSPHSAPHCFRDPRHRASMAILYDDDHLVAYRTTSEADTGDSH